MKQTANRKRWWWKSIHWRRWEKKEGKKFYKQYKDERRRNFLSLFISSLTFSNHLRKRQTRSFFIRHFSHLGRSFCNNPLASLVKQQQRAQRRLRKICLNPNSNASDRLDICYFLINCIQEPSFLVARLKACLVRSCLHLSPFVYAFL